MPKLSSINMCKSWIMWSLMMTWQSFSFFSTSLMSSCSARSSGCGKPFDLQLNFMFVHFRMTSRWDTFTKPPVNWNYTSALFHRVYNFIFSVFLSQVFWGKNYIEEQSVWVRVKQLLVRISMLPHFMLLSKINKFILSINAIYVP